MGEDSILSREEMLKKIERAHSNDGKILFHLSELRKANNQPEWTALLDQAIDRGYEQPEAYLKRARLRIDNNDSREGAIEDARRVLRFNRITPPMIREVVGLLMGIESSIPTEVVNSPAVVSLDLDDMFWLAQSFDRTREELPIAVLLWKKVLETLDLPTVRRNEARRFLGLAYMGLGRCSDAAKMFRSEEQNLENLNIENAFNYGMAMWGVKGVAERKIFQRVVELDREDARDDATPNYNYLQCMAVTYWAVGNRDSAIEYVERAQRAVSTLHNENLFASRDLPPRAHATQRFVGALRGRREFSCWRYLYVDAGLFKKDLDAIRALIEGDKARMPLFLTGSGDKGHRSL